MSSAALDHPSRRDVEVIGLVGLAHGTSHFFHLMLPPLFPWLMADFGLSYTQVGFLMTVFFVVSGFGQALAGFVVDRVGARPVLLFGVGTLAFSGVLVALAGSYSGLLLAAAVAGVGNSIFHPADFTLLNRRVSSTRLGHAFSVHGLAGNLGWAAGPVFMAGIAAVAGWHVAGLAAASVGLVVLVLLISRRHVLDDAAAEAAVAARAGSPPEPVNAHGQFAFLRAGAVWMCFVFFLLVTAAFGVLQNYSPAILHHVYGITLVAATAGLTAYLLGSAAGMVAGGFVAARQTNSDFVIAAALGLSAVMALVLASGEVPSWSVFGVMAIMGFGVGLAGPSRDLLVRKAATAQFGKASYGRVYGFVYSGLDIGLAASPIVFGPLLDAGHFGAALIGIAVLQVAALASALRVGRRTRAVALG
jgi:predicted MFS family arabinose efflux permease